MLHALRLQVDAGQLRHLAGAEDEDVQRREVAEDLARQLDRRIADRDRPLAEAGFGADPLADGERGVEEAMGHGAGKVQVARQRVGALHLAENLRLADDQRVEAAGDAKEVARRIVAAVDVEMLGEPAGLDAVILAEEARDGVGRRLAVAEAVDLRAVAGRQDDGLGADRARRERRQRRRQPAAAEVHRLAQLHRRRPVADPDSQQAHGH